VAAGIEDVQLELAALAMLQPGAAGDAPVHDVAGAVAASHAPVAAAAARHPLDLRNSNSISILHASTAEGCGLPTRSAPP
jgi:hypothetical protein